MDELKGMLIKLLLDYYEHGKNLDTIAIDTDIEPILEYRDKIVSRVELPVKPEIADIDKGLVANLVGEIENDWQMGGFGGTIYEDFARELLYRYLKEKQFSV